MRKIYTSSITLVFLLVLSIANAQATPAFNSYWNGSYFFIDATNDEDKSYNCSVSYSWSYSDFGDRKTK